MLRLLTFFVVGAVLGTVGDLMHVSGGVLGYPGATLFGEKPWVPLLMGASTLSLVVSHALLRARWREPAGGVSTVQALAGGAAFLAAWGATAVFWRTPNALALGLALAYALWPGALRLRAFLFALSVAAVGPVIEATLSFVGGFSYFTGHLALGVPLWLPALYLHAAMALASIERRWPVFEDAAAPAMA